MTTQLAPAPIFRAWDNLGFPLFSGKLFTYIAGTTTKQATFTDSTGGTPNTNPVILNFRGEANIWLDPTKVYKFVLAPANDTDPPTNPFWTVDQISGGSLSPTGSIIPTVDNLFTLGSTSFSWANVYVGPNHAPVLDVTGNIGYYARTAAEIAASVTPTNYSYPPYNILRYGASPAASAAVNAAALMAAINVIGSTGGEITLPPGNYQMSSDVITFPHTNVTLTGAGTGMGYAAATPGTQLIFGAGTIGINCTQITGGGGGGNYTLIRCMGINGTNACQYPIKAKGVVLFDDLTVTGSTAAGAGMWLFDFINSTRLNRVSIFLNAGVGIIIGGSGGGTGSNTLMTMNNCTIRENAIGMILEQALQFTLRDTVIESNINEGLIIFQRTGQVAANIELDNVWFENNWAAGTSANYNVHIDSQTHDVGAGPPSYIRFTNCKFSATNSAGAILIDSVRYCLFENCGGSGAVTLNAFASYVGFYNWNGGTITNGGNRCWTGFDDASNIGGPSYSALNAQKLQVGLVGTPIVNKVKGTATFAAATTSAVLFPTTLPAGAYQISFSQSATSPLPPWWTVKQPTGFTINFSAAFTGNVDWIVEQ